MKRSDRGGLLALIGDFVCCWWVGVFWYSVWWQALIVSVAGCEVYLLR